MGKAKGTKQRPAGGAAVIDRLLQPRIENYALNNDYTDVDEVVDHLRRCYKEYQRKQVRVLRQMADRAIKLIQANGVTKPEIEIQVGNLYHDQ